jgi:tricorn protease
MRLHTPVAICITLVIAASAVAADAPLPRHPAPSPDGSQIAFSWQGDLWLVPSIGGDARRITAHPADERYPVWSRDGRFIAFASNRHGNADIFTMPTDGSAPPIRLTFASVTDIPFDFTPDGKAVLFVSNRAMGIRWMPQLWTVPITGGTPAMLQDAFAEQAVYSPDGGTLAMVRGATPWNRRGYRGSANRDLWLTNGADDYRRITDFDGDDDKPSWLDTETISFLSSRNGRKNVFKLAMESGEISALTDHQGSAVRFPKASADGSIIAYEFEDGIWTVSPAGESSARLSIRVPADQVVNAIERHIDRDGASDLTVSPDGKLAAFVIHGDLFVTDIVSKEDQEIAKPPTVRLTSTPEREQQPRWSPDGEKLVFSSARNGNLDLFSLTRPDEDVAWTDSFDFTTKPIATGPENEQNPQFSPDGEFIAFVRGKGQLVVVDTEGGNEIVLNDHFYPPTFNWSPDGRWIAYASEDQHANSEIFIVPTSGGEPYNVSRHPDFDENPVWSPDGKRLVWGSHRHDNSFDVWAIWLTQADHERSPAEWLKVWRDDDEPEDEDDDSAEEGDGEDESDPPESPETVIEFDRLWQRSVKLTTLNGDEYPVVVGPDGKKIFLVGEAEDETDLFSIRFDGEELERLTEGDTSPESVQLIDDSTLFFLDGGGSIQRIGMDGSDEDPVPFKARYEVDRRVERGVVFDEAWAALNDQFYDPGFHGADWSAIHDTYRPWAVDASCDADFSDVVNLMLGELNASHMGYYATGRGGPSDGDQTGWIGAVFDPTAGGPGLLVSEVLPDSPAANAEVGIKEGERLLGVNGHEVETDTNIYDLFVDTIGERVPTTVRAADGSARSVILRPIAYGSHRQLRYEEWVRQRRRMVEEASDGRLGYLHIQGMSAPSFEVFERDLYAAADGKEGLIIDVRSNGGGWTTDYLMAVLTVQRHAFTIPRDGDASVKSYPTAERLPVGAFTRPAATLCNEDSYSNAEIFSWAFQTLGRGPLVGSPTFGAVISTGGMELINGGWVRLPGRGWYVAGSGINMEKQGAQPDVVVWQPPAEESSATVDTQLETAVRVRLEGIEEDPRYGSW